MPIYTLIRRFEDGREESAEFDGELGAIDVGNMIRLDDDDWRIDNVILNDDGDPTTLIVTQH